MTICLKKQEGFWVVFPDEIKEQGAGLVTVVMTLGAGIDILQERYQRTDRMLESYMVENISGELLMEGYRQFGEWIASKTQWKVKAFHFPGGEKAFPLELLPELLKTTGQQKGTCNRECCMQPKKRGAFLAELSAGSCEKAGESGSACDGTGEMRGVCEGAGEMRGVCEGAGEMRGVREGAGEMRDAREGMGAICATCEKRRDGSCEFWENLSK